MANRSRETVSPAVRAATYRIVRNNTRRGGSVSQDRVLRRLVAEGHSREAGRRALQQLLATDAIRLRNDRVRLVQ